MPITTTAGEEALAKLEFLQWWQPGLPLAYDDQADKQQSLHGLRSPLWGEAAVVEVAEPLRGGGSHAKRGDDPRRRRKKKAAAEPAFRVEPARADIYRRAGTELVPEQAAPKEAPEKDAARKSTPAAPAPGEGIVGISFTEREVERKAAGGREPEQVAAELRTLAALEAMEKAETAQHALLWLMVA